jgi:UDP-glucuronate 4-epimerase
MAHYLVTGAAGFIASRVTEMLIEQGHTVTGVDNLNDAYDVRMKEHRLRNLQALPGFTFQKLDISQRASLENLPTFEAVINLAARAGVRASVEDPWAFIETNVTGTLNLLEQGHPQVHSGFHLQHLRSQGSHTNTRNCG